MPSDESATSTNPWTGLDDTLQNARLYFAQSNLENLQNLVRFIDQKAAFILTAVGVLTAALFTLVAGTVFAPARTTFDTIAKIVLGLTTLAYTILASTVVYAVAQITSAGSSTLKPDTRAPGMIFPLTLLQRYNADEASYHARLLDLSYADMLHDYANQMMEVSNIYQQKHRYVNSSVSRFRWLSVAWIIAVLIGTMILLGVA
jgi:hypothetical protein